MNEASERVLLKFAELLRNNPNGNVPFLWVQAGGRVASQQSFAPDVAICEDCKKNPALEGCTVCAECGL